MVIANVLNTYTTAAGLWQYDYGQILRLQGIKLPTAVEIHFHCKKKVENLLQELEQQKME